MSHDVRYVIAIFKGISFWEKLHFDGTAVSQLALSLPILAHAVSTNGFFGDIVRSNANTRFSTHII